MSQQQPLLTKGDEDHTQHVLGRRRRASVITRLIGHFQFARDKSALIAAIVLLETNPGISELRKTILDRVTLVPRFRSKLVLTKRSGGYFEEVPIDVGYHFEVFGFGRKVSRAELNAFVQGTQEWPMDFAKPLWKVVHVPELEHGGSAVLFVVHHAIGDGVSLVDVMLGLVDESDKLQENVKVSKRAHAPTLSFYHRANAFLKGVGDGFTLATSRPDAINPLKFKGTCGKQKMIASSESYIQLAQVKQVAKQITEANVSVNDVLVATLTKALAIYFQDHCVDCDPKKMKRVRAQFPINMRPRNKPVRNEHGDPTNDFAYGLFPIPLEAHDDSKKLILAVKLEADKIKHSPAAIIGRKQLPYQVKAAPLSLILDLMDNLNNLGTCTISNVPGPQHQVSLAGAPITNFEFFLFTMIQSYVGIFSYDGKIACTVNLDKQVNADPQLLANLFVKAFDDIYNDICGPSASKIDNPTTVVSETTSASAEAK